MIFSRLRSTTVETETIIAALLGIMFGFSPLFFGGRDTWGMFALFAGTAVIALLALKTGIRSLATPWWRSPDLWSFLFLVAVFISSMLSVSKRVSLMALAWFIAGWVLFVSARALTQRKHRLILAVFLVLSGLLQTTWAFVILPGHDKMRLFGTIKNSDGLGPWLLLPLFTSIGLFFQVQRRWLKRSAGISFVLLLIAFAMTSSVGATCGAFAALLLGAWWFRPRLSRRVVGTSLLLLLFTLGSIFLIRAVMSPTVINDSAVTSTTGFKAGAVTKSWNQRWKFISSSIDIAAQHPWFGVGPDMWRDYFPAAAHSVLEASAQAHGLLPQYVAELGWLGLTCFLLLLLAVGWALAETTRQHPSPLRKAWLLAAAASAIAGLIDIGWYFPSTVMMFWAIAGMLAAPASAPIKRTGIRRSLNAVLAITAISLLAFAILRIISTTFTTLAENAGHERKWLEGFSTADIVMTKVLPSYEEELRLGYLVNFGAVYSFDKATAQRYAERILADDPHQAQAYLLLGTMLEQKDPERAKELFRQGLAIDPHFTPDLATQLTNMLLLELKVDDAYAVAHSMLANVGVEIQNRPTAMAGLYVAVARTELAKNESDAAHDHLLEALRYDLSNANAKTLLQNSFPQP